MDPSVRFMLEVMAAALLVICIPIIIAFYRGHPNRWVILIVTVAFGATVVGWLIALVWSLHGFHRSEGRLRHGGESGLNFHGNDDDFGMVSTEPTVRFADQDFARIIDSGNRTAARLSVQSAAEQIERIVRLREDGHIGADEFQALKREILKKLD